MTWAVLGYCSSRGRKRWSYWPFYCGWTLILLPSNEWLKCASFILISEHIFVFKLNRYLKSSVPCRRLTNFSDAARYLKSAEPGSTHYIQSHVWETTCSLFVLFAHCNLFLSSYFMSVEIRGQSRYHSVLGFPEITINIFVVIF